ncbi:hypothetical protein AAC387_Pa02g4405 [Persea americana]
MSRCFPFPPPGYEKEARNDDIESLQKEKHKEKKQKKEKKDKEKREDKEKRDKERSKDKNKEKKERKEKHKHKKKEKDRDKEKNSTPDDNRTVKGRNEGCNEEKLGESSSQAVDHMETKLTEELGKRVKNEARPAENQMLRETNAPVQRTSESMFNAPDQRRAMGHMETKLMEEQGKSIKNEARPAENQVFRETIASVQRRSENMFNAPNKKKAVGHMEAKLTEELGKRIKNEARPAENQVFRETIAPIQRRIESTFNAPDQRRVESLGRAVEKEKEKEKGTAQKEKKEGDNRRPERRDDSVGVGGTAENIIMGQIINGTDQSAGQQRSEGKEKNKDKKSKEGDDRGGDRHKDKNREEKRSKKKDKKRDKEKEKEKDKVKEKCEDRPTEWDKLKDSQKEQMNAVNIKAPVPPTSSNNSEKSIGSEGNLKKRKDFETNGFAYENDLHPTKLPRLASSSQMPLENGKNFESSHISIRCSSERREGCSSERLGETNYRKGEINKEHKINGTVKVQPSTVISMRTSVPLEPFVGCEASNRPPHPDSIRLNQLLSIPKMEEWSDFDDQEWLFSSNSIHSKATAPDAATEAMQVWREALRIESADVIALPYVIPF